MQVATRQPTAEVGVIIARLQVPELHRAHRELIEAVQQRHKKVLLLLGVTTVRVSRHNPLDFWTRERMVKALYPHVVVQPIKDQPTDGGWSRLVDSKIDDVANGSRALLYGSRDSFIPHYQGKYPTQELEATRPVSGKDLRQAASEEVRGEKAYRTGVIYAAHQRYPTSYQTVDVLVWRRQRLDTDTDKLATGPVEFLLARKNADPEGHWRFIGGFVDPQQDDSLEAAATREVHEEAGHINIATPVYLLSARVDDWRYRAEADAICTALLTAEFLWGSPQAADDIDAVQWVAAEQIGLARRLVPEHAPIWEQAVGPLRERLVLDGR